jgi:biofilm PGA synthesis N-glycosyltransferase PgaC
MNPLTIKYVVITPVRDEEAYLQLTIDSMVRQTVLPQEWIIVDDGSKDGTGRIIEEAVRLHPWIRGVRREDRGFRQWGAGIIEAFYAGFHALTSADWEFMAKLDGDLSFEPDYFAQMFAKFGQAPRLGVGGGFLYHIENQKKTLEQSPTFHVRGGAKIYRHACWDAIGGLWVGPGSDTLDEVKANMLGWTSQSFLELQIQHHRWTGAAYGRWGGIAKNGKTDYVAGYHPLFLVAKCVARLWQRPYVWGSFALLYGYISAYFQQIPRVDDPQLIRYLQRQQMAKLCRQETIWK